ncbi:MAG: hypothetical protein H8D45_26515 [Bacteroidetes bacterium]|nr:hypothetical protein [Bacteroidota bacterium]
MKKKNLFIIIGVILFIIGCSSVEKEVIELYDTDTKKAEIKSLNTNLLIEDMDKFHGKGNYKNGNKVGKWIWYQDDGTIEMEGIFKDGKTVGKWTWYYSNGKIKMEVFFTEDEKITKWIKYDEEGNVIEEKAVGNQ